MNFRTAIYGITIAAVFTALGASFGVRRERARLASGLSAAEAVSSAAMKLQTRLSAEDAGLRNTISVLSNELADASAKLKAEKDANVPLREMVSALSSERIAQSARENDLRDRLKNGSNATDALRKKLEEKTSLAEKATRERDATAYLLSDMDAITAERDALAKEIAGLEDNTAQLAKEKNQLASERDSLRGERDNLQKEKNSEAEKAKKSSAELTSVKEKLAASEAEVKTLRAEVESRKTAE